MSVNRIFNFIGEKRPENPATYLEEAISLTQSAVHVMIHTHPITNRRIVAESFLMPSADDRAVDNLLGTFTLQGLMMIEQQIRSAVFKTVADVNDLHRPVTFKDIAASLRHPLIALKKLYNHANEDDLLRRIEHLNHLEVLLHQCKQKVQSYN